MFELGKLARGAKFMAVIGAMLFVAACAQTQPDGLQGNVKPGTGQDFVVNVGDRVFFEEDQSTLNAQAKATLDKQAQWLSSYGKYTITVEGHADERGTGSTTLPLARAGPMRPGTIWSPAAYPPRASRRFPTARNGRSPCVTTTAAGRRTGAP